MAKDGKNGKGDGKGKGGDKGRFDIPDFPGSGDPSFEAEARAIMRGLEDALRDLKLNKKWTKQDFRTSIEDLEINRDRTLEDLGRDLERGLLDLRFQKRDTKQGLRRGTQDFRMRIEEMTRNYSQLGSMQGQAMNAGGASAGSGQARAAEARRAENMAFERQPLDVSMKRMRQDTATNLDRIGLQKDYLRTDASQTEARTMEDYLHDKQLMRRDYKRDRKEMKLEKQRAMREAEITAADLLAQSTWANKQYN